MNRINIVVTIGLALAAALPTTPAQAQAVRTFVAPPPTGNDSNPRTITLPCRFLQRALTQTAPGGEIAILGTAGYNNGATVNITQAVSIVNPGGFEAGIIVPSGSDGILIGTVASAAVSLRGLTIEGAGVGAYGIVFSNGGSLTIDNCVIRNLTGDGIIFYGYPNAPSSLTITNSVVSYNGDTGILFTPSSATNRLDVSNSLVANNGQDGVHVSPTGSGAVSAVINRVEANNNTSFDMFFDQSQTTGSVNSVVSDSVVTASAVGIFTAGSTLSVVRSIAAFNSKGFANLEGTIYLAQSTVTQNTFGLEGSFQSYGDNYINGNSTDLYSGSVLAPVSKR